MDPLVKSRPAARRLMGPAGAKAQPPASEQNKRWAARRRSDLPGYLYSDKLSSAVACHVRDHSSSGALVQIARNSEVTVDDVPDQFVLVFRSNRDQTKVKCAIVRRHADCLGVRYCGMFRTTPVTTRRR